MAAPTQQAPAPGGSTIVSLLSDLRDEAALLLRRQVELAKAEVNAMARRVGRRLGLFVTGVAVALAGLIILLLGCGRLMAHGLVTLGLSNEIAVWLGPMSVGAVAVGLGVAILLRAEHALRDEAIFPPETARTLRDDKRWVEEKLTPSAPS